jgi:uncharacterized protein YbjT (DUF2867 family)/uncharacterized protein YjeT (DUF2065 family)
VRILLTGATGFIGQALARALLRNGHELVCAVRDPARLSLPEPGRWRAIACDLAQVPDAGWWRAHLEGVDAVVNSVGIIRETPGQTFEALHHQAPAALFRASASAGVRAVVQVSALGADTGTSRYHRSKHAADEVLRGLGVAGAIVQPSLVYGAQGASAGLFNTLAAAPLLAMPQSGGMQVQPVHVDDVIDGIVRLVESPPTPLETITFSGPRPLSMRDYLRGLRAALGVPGTLHVLPYPRPLFMLGAGVAAHLPGSVLDTETAGMLLAGNAGPSERFARLLQRQPREVARFISPSQAPALRTQAVLGLWLPVLRVALALLWIWTAAVSFGLYPVQDSLALLARLGLTGSAAATALYGAAALNLVLGIFTLACPARWRRLLWAAQLLLIGGYTVLISVFLPEYWLHPYGPISKNLPILAAIGMLWSLEPAHRTVGPRAPDEWTTSSSSGST